MKLGLKPKSKRSSSATHDPAESNDVSRDHPDLCAGLRAKLDAWEATMPASNPPVSSLLKAGSKP